MVKRRLASRFVLQATFCGLVLAGEGDASAQRGADVQLDVGTLPAGKSVTITFDATIDDPFPMGLSQVSNQGTVSSDQGSALTDDPNTPEPNDPTTTGVQVPTTTPTLTSTATPTPTITPGGPTLTPTLTLTPTPTITPGGPTLTPIPTATAFPGALCGRSDGCWRWDLLEADQSVPGEVLFRWRLANDCSSPLARADFRFVPAGQVLGVQDGGTYTSPGSHTYQIDVVGGPHPGIAFVPDAVDPAPIGTGEADEFSFRIASSSLSSSTVLWNRASAAGGEQGRMDMSSGLCYQLQSSVLGASACYRETGAGTWELEVRWSALRGTAESGFRLLRIDAAHPDQPVPVGPAVLEPDASGQVLYTERRPAGSVQGYRIQTLDRGGVPLGPGVEVELEACSTRLGAGFPAAGLWQILLLLAVCGLLARRLAPAGTGSRRVRRTVRLGLLLGVGFAATSLQAMLGSIQLTATKTDVLLVDLNGDNQANPGETLRYTVVITNSGPADLTGVTFADTLDTNTTLVPGSVHSTPLAYGQMVTTPEDTFVDITLTGADADGDTLSFSVVTPPSAGTLSNLTQVPPDSATVRYTPNGDTNGADSFVFRVTDDDASTDDATVGITVSAVNDAPVVNLDLNNSGGNSPDFVAGFTEDGGPVLIGDTDAGATDVDDTNLESATFTLTNRPDGVSEVLSADVTGTSITLTPYDSGTGVLALSGTDTLANYQQVLRTVRYDNTAQNPDSTARTITVVANDGTDPSTTVSSTVQFTALNDAPVLTDGGGSPSFTEDGGPVTLDAAIGVSDVDSPNLLSATVTLTNRPDGAAESLAATTGGTAITALYTPGTGVLSLTGTDTLANYQTVLRSVAYDNTSQNPDAANRSITFVANDGTVNSNTVTKTLTFTAVNDAPVVTASGGTTSFTEDGGAVTVDGGLTVSDVDNANLASATVTITNLLDSGLETLAATTGGTAITASYVAPTLTLSGSDSVANYQTVLRSVTYDNTSQNLDTTTRVLNFVANDGTANSNTASKDVSVAAINDPPVVTASGGTTAFTEDGGAVTVDGGLTVSDADNANLASATVTISNLLDAGAETLTATTGGTAITASYVAPTLTLSGSDTVANYQTVLRSVTYDNTSQNPTTTTRVLNFVANDGAANSNTASKNVSVAAINDPPVVTASGGTTSFTEDGGAVTVDSGLTVSDADNANLASATVTISNLLNAGAETLAASTGGTAITASYVAPTLTLSGSDTVSNYQTVLRSVTYDNTSQNPSTTTRVLNFVANDGTANSSTASKNVSVAAINDPPVVTASGGTTAFTEDGGAVTVDGALTVTDADNANLASATVTISNLLNAGAETLAASTGGTAITANYVAPTLTLSGSDTVGNYQTVLRSVTYDNTSQNPSTTTRVLNFVANDGTVNSSTASKNVSVAAINDAPVVTASGGTTAFTEDGPAVTVDGALTVTDADNANLASATVTISNLLNAGAETLAASTGGTAITANYVAPTLTLSGSDSVANYQTVLRSVTYDNTSQNPSTTTRVLNFVANDGTANSSTASKNVSVAAINDAPVVTASGGTTAFTEDGPAVTVDGALTVTDADNANLASATVTISNLLNAGAETLAASTGGTAITANYVAPTLTLSGSDSVANYQTVLRSVTYDNTSQNPSTTTRVLNFVANDGTANSSTASKNVSVAAINDAPVVTASGGTTAFTEDGPAVTVDGALTVTDADNANLASATVTISNLLNAGAETLAASTGGTAITANYVAPTLTLSGSDTVGNYQTVLRSVTYNNTSQNPNTTTRVLNFVANDGTVNSNTASKNVSVAAINDAPVVTASGGTTAFTEDGPAVTVDGALTVTDADNANLASATVTISNLLNAGAETLAASTGGTAITANYVAPTLTLSGSDTVGNYQTVLRSVTYNNTSQNPSTTTRVLNFVANDGTANSSTASKNVSVTAVNDAPVVTASGGTTAFTEDGGSVVVDGALTVSDVDNTNLASATVTISNLLNAGLETLSATTGGTSITANYVAPTLTLSGSDSVGNYQTVLRSVRYNNTSQNPNTTTRVLNFVANDGTVNSNTAGKNVSVTAVNDAPVADNDPFDFIGNTELRVDVGTSTTPHALETTPSTFGVIDGDSDPAEGDAIAVSAITVGACTDNTLPTFDCTVAAVGTVHMQPNGRFSFEPAPGDTDASETFQYTLTDNGTPTPASTTATVTLTRFERVWYVDPAAGGGGNGTSVLPLNVLMSLNGAGGAGDPDLQGDYIFIHAGTLTGSIELENNQHLVGQGHVEVTTPSNFALSIPVNLNGNGSPTNLVATTTHPQLTNASGNTVVVTTQIPVEIVGLSLAGGTIAGGGACGSPTFACNAIDLTTAAALTGSSTLTIRNNELRGAGAEGVDVNLNAGTSGTLAVTATNNFWNTGGTHTGNAFDARTASATANLRVNFSNNTNILSTGASGVIIDGSVGGTVTITGFANNTVHQNTVSTGIAVTSAIFDTTPGNPINQVSGGTTVIGASGNGVGASGLILTGVVGDVSFTDLDVFADGGAGLSISSIGALNAAAGTGFRLVVPASVSNIDADGGPAVNVNNASVTLPLNFLESTNSTTTGVSLVNAFGGLGATALSVPSGSGQITDPGGASGTAVNIDGGTGNITLGIPITNNSGRAISVTNRDSTGPPDETGTISFTGVINETGLGVFLDNNDVATMSFTGGVIASTGANAAFTATNGGTVTVTDPNPVGTAPDNTLTTTTGTALNVANTTIGASGLNFRSISAGTAASGPANGILLNNTGASGGLTVAGNGNTTVGGDNSGGTIQNTTGFGISLTSTFNPSFTNIRVMNTIGHGLGGTDVTNFTCNYSSIDDSNTDGATTTEEANIGFYVNETNSTRNNLDGTVSIVGNQLTNAQFHGIDIFSFSGTIDDITISGNTITSSSSTANSQGSGIRLIAFGSATTIANVTRATIANNVVSNFPSGAGIMVQGGNGNAAGPAGVFGTAGSATNIIAITGNRVAGFSAANRIGTQGIIAAVNGRGQGNFNISNNGTVANPITNMIGAGIAVSSLGFANVTATIDNNRIVANNSAGAQGIGTGTSATFAPGAETPSLTVTITNNNVSQTDGNGILVTARDASATLRAKIQNNTVAAPLAGNRNGIRVDSGNALSGDEDVCLNISGNTSAGVNLSPEGIGIRKQGTVAATNNFALHGLATSPASQAQAAAYVTSQNPGSAMGTLIISGDNFNSPTCSFP